MRSVRTAEYHQMLRALPEIIQERAAQAWRIFRDNPHDPRLGRHDLHDSGRGRHRNGSFAVWLNRQYRAICVVDEGEYVWYWVGSHADYDRFLG